MTTEEAGELDVSNPVLGSIRAKGYRIMDIVCLIALGITVYIAFTIFHHNAEAKDTSREIAQAIKDSNKEVAQTLKETNAQVTEAIKQMAVEQRRANEIGREQTCLLTLPPDRRTNAGEFCKRLSRERDIR